MNRNVMIVLAGGFLIAVLVALLVQASLSGGKEEPVVLQEEPKVKIIVASKNLKAGTELSEDNMKWQDWPKSAVFPGAIKQQGNKTPEEMVEGVLARSVEEGEPIIRGALVDGEGDHYLAATIVEGKRAYTLNLKKQHGERMVAGFARPGTYVDVLVTYRRSLEFNGQSNAQIEDTIDNILHQSATETVVQNARVLAVDRDPGTGEGEVKAGATVTLEVSFREAEILALASQMGTVSLSLRKLGDDKIVPPNYPVTTDARTTRVEEDFRAEIEKMQVDTGQATEIVRIYRGDEIEEVTVRP